MAEISSPKLYTGGSTEEAVIAVAFPGFRDIYKDAGLHDSIGYIDNQEGKTFIKTLELAWKSNSQLIQIATWNDYDEGAVIEPTRAFKYQHLEVIQNTLKRVPKQSPCLVGTSYDFL